MTDQTYHKKLQNIINNTYLSSINQILSELHCNYKFQNINKNINKNLDIDINLDINIAAKSNHENIKKSIFSNLKANNIDITNITLNINTKISNHAVKNNIAPIKNVKNIIAIASGKGGVGKSTLCCNLALALKQEGAKVGILDADIYGPSQPQMMGSYEKPELDTSNPNKKALYPVIRYGIQTMSMGYLIEKDRAMIWRGPMVSSALQQLITDTKWDDLDYLLIDLPPGTGDIQLTLSQKIPVTGAVIITTPQDISLLDARRALKMFDKVKIPNLGIIENMSYHICPNCDFKSNIFGENGGQNLAQESNINLIGKLPLDIKIRQETDTGLPTVEKSPEHNISQIFKKIATQISIEIAKTPKSYAHIMPEIKIKVADNLKNNTKTNTKINTNINTNININTKSNIKTNL